MASQSLAKLAPGRRPSSLATLGDLRRDGGEQPAFLACAESPAQALDPIPLAGLPRSHHSRISAEYAIPRQERCCAAQQAAGQPVDDRLPGRVLRVDHVEVIGPSSTSSTGSPEPAADARTPGSAMAARCRPAARARGAAARPAAAARRAKRLHSARAPRPASRRGTPRPRHHPGRRATPAARSHTPACETTARAGRAGSAPIDTGRQPRPRSEPQRQMTTCRMADDHDAARVDLARRRRVRRRRPRRRAGFPASRRRPVRPAGTRGSRRRSPRPARSYASGVISVRSQRSARSRRGRGRHTARARRRPRGKVEIRDLIRVVAVADDGGGRRSLPLQPTVARPARHASRRRRARERRRHGRRPRPVVEVGGDAEVVVAVRADDPLLRELADEPSDVGRPDADERPAPDGSAGVTTVAPTPPARRGGAR